MSTRRGMRSYSTRSQTNSGKRQRNPAQESLSDNAAAHNAKRKKKDDDEIPEELSSDEDKQEAFMARLDETNKGLQGFEISVPLFNQFFRGLEKPDHKSLRDTLEAIDSLFAATIAHLTAMTANLTATTAGLTATIAKLTTLEGEAEALETTQTANDLESLTKHQQTISLLTSTRQNLKSTRQDLDSARQDLNSAAFSKVLVERLQNGWKGQLNSFML
jgi:hypothetical protein